MDPNPNDQPPLKVLPTLDQVQAWLALLYQPDNHEKLKRVAWNICSRNGISREYHDVMQDAYVAVRNKLCSGAVTYQGQRALKGLFHDNMEYLALDRARRLGRMIATPLEALDHHSGQLLSETDYEIAEREVRAATRTLPAALRESVETRLENETLPGSEKVPPRNHRSNLKEAKESMRNQHFPKA